MIMVKILMKLLKVMLKNALHCIFIINELLIKMKMR